MQLVVPLESAYTSHHTGDHHVNQGKDGDMGWSGFIMVGTGAALGAWLRWMFSVLMNAAFPLLPLGTLCANLIGGFLMGMVLAMLPMQNSLSPDLRLFITTGFLGGLTTFSTFSGESFTLLSRGEYGWGLLHMALHVLGSLALTALGFMAIHSLKS